MEHYLEQKTETEESKAEQLEVVVIPNLSWCFLRSIEGLEGIEYLQSLLCDRSNHRFWIIGAGEVGWEYSNSVCNLEAYCGKVFSLPAIATRKTTGMARNPVTEEMNLIFDKPRVDKQLLDSDKDNKTNYFEHLTSISKGISIVAVQGFLKSIRYQEIDLEEKDEEDIKPKAKNLVAQIPKLPDLPTLEPVEQYLLYSLLLHGDLTIPALAESLGDATPKSKPQYKFYVEKV